MLMVKGGGGWCVENMGGKNKRKQRKNKKEKESKNREHQ